ncbi:MAG: hypothetical protein H7172_08945, partial [Ferruginibacter sp.]|nr:hypothetical protein [Rhodoferax sp.]
MNRTSHNWRVGLAALLLCTVAAVAVGEWLGWPFLAGPLQNFLSEKLDRRVRFADTGAPNSGFAIRFIGGIRLTTPLLDVAAPSWSTAPNMLRADDVALELRYMDLWRAYRGEPIRIHSLQARRLDGNIERLADGRASWQFGKTPAPASPDKPTRLPEFGTLRISNGLVHYADAPLTANLDATLSLVPGPAAADGRQSTEVKVEAAGRYRKLPLKITLASSAVLPSNNGSNPSVLPVAVTLDAIVGRAHLE